MRGIGGWKLGRRRIKREGKRRKEANKEMEEDGRRKREGEK